MIDGALTTDVKGRGTKSIVKRYEEIIAELKQKYSDVEAIGITHDGLSDYSNQIIGMLKNAFPNAQMHTSYASASVMTHAGPEAVSFQFLIKNN
jgi:fatty acid-binding protein DegV